MLHASGRMYIQKITVILTKHISNDEKETLFVLIPFPTHISLRQLALISLAIFNSIPVLAFLT